MATDKQIEANRLNAAMSTGPTTQGGIERASRNSVKHGLTAASVVLKNENALEFDEFRRAYFDELKPVGQVEEYLVERIAVCCWRLRRGPKFEAAMLQQAQREVDEEFSLNQALNFQGIQANILDRRKPDEGAAYLKLFSPRGSSGGLLNLTRHENHIERSALRAWTELERCQARRRGELVSKVNLAHETHTAAKVPSADAKINGNDVSLSKKLQSPNANVISVRHRARPT